MRAVFLDKDGTLVKDVPYNIRPELIRLEPFVVDGLKSLQEKYSLIIITNQAGLARGYFKEQELQNYFLSLLELFKMNGVFINGFYYCPHFPGGIMEKFNKNCDCRKPLPGLIQKAAVEHDIDLKNSWMIGDILHDVEAGNRAGCKTILINNGNETEWETGQYRIPDFTAKDFKKATEYILSQGD